jgi:hypothetical protein
MAEGSRAAREALSSSGFADILRDSAEKALKEVYADGPSTWAKWAKWTKTDPSVYPVVDP